MLALWLGDACQEPDRCPEPGSWPSVWLVFSPSLYPAGANGQRRGWSFADSSRLLGWPGAGSCSAPSRPPHQCSLSPRVLRRGARFSYKRCFCGFYFTFATTATNTKAETGQKALRVCVFKAVSEACRKSTLTICIKTSTLTHVGKVKCWKSKTWLTPSPCKVERKWF